MSSSSSASKYTLGLPACSGYDISFAPPVEHSCATGPSASRTPEVFGRWFRRVVNPLKICYRKRPGNLAVMEHGKGQKANTPVITRKARSDKLPVGLVISPLLTKSIKRTPTGSPSEVYRLGPKVYLCQG